MSGAPDVFGFVSSRALLRHHQLEGRGGGGRGARRGIHADRVGARRSSRILGAAAAASAGSQPQRGESQNHNQPQEAHAAQ